LKHLHKCISNKHYRRSLPFYCIAYA